MADISKITAINGTSYDIKDATARAGLSNKADKSDTVSITATTEWTGATAPYTQTITATGVTASNNIVVGLASTATSTQYDAAVNGKILCTAQAANSITLTAYGEKPSVSIPFTVIIVG